MSKSVKEADLTRAVDRTVMALVTFGLADELEVLLEAVGSRPDKLKAALQQALADLSPRIEPMLKAPESERSHPRHPRVAKVQFDAGLLSRSPRSQPITVDLSDYKTVIKFEGDVKEAIRQVIDQGEGLVRVAEKMNVKYPSLSRSLGSHVQIRRSTLDKLQKVLGISHVTIYVTLNPEGSQ